MRLWFCCLLTVHIERWEYLRKNFGYFFLFLSLFFYHLGCCFFRSAIFSIQQWMCLIKACLPFVVATRNELLKAIRIGIIFSVVDDFSFFQWYSHCAGTFQNRLFFANLSLVFWIWLAFFFRLLCSVLMISRFRISHIVCIWIWPYNSKDTFMLMLCTARKIHKNKFVIIPANVHFLLFPSKWI